MPTKRSQQDTSESIITNCNSLFEEDFSTINPRDLQIPDLDLSDFEVEKDASEVSFGVQTPPDSDALIPIEFSDTRNPTHDWMTSGQEPSLQCEPVILQLVEKATQVYNGAISRHQELLLEIQKGRNLQIELQLKQLSMPFEFNLT